MKMILSADRSCAAILSGPRSMIRASITGTTINAVTSLPSRLARVCSGSKWRRTTRVEPSAKPSAVNANPRAWNIGTHSSVTSRARNGTLPSRPPMIDSDRGSSRGAPFGVPVVPLVRITIFGATRSLGGVPVKLDSISASSVSPPPSAPPSVQARKRPCGGSTPWSMSAYSSS